MSRCLARIKCCTSLPDQILSCSYLFHTSAPQRRRGNQISTRDADSSNATARDRSVLVNEAASLLKQSSGNIRDMPTAERSLLEGTRTSGWVLAQSREHLAVATSGNAFVIVPRKQLTVDVSLGQKVDLQAGKTKIKVSSLERSRGR